MKVHESVVRTELERYLPFLMTTTMLMAAVKKGVGREEAHEIIKEHAVAVSQDLRSGKISRNDLLERLGADARLRLSAEEIQRLYAEGAGETGMAAHQVDTFCEQVKKITEAYPDAAGYTPGEIL